ncbi:Phosphodiest-domain-containing protein [Teratosphaeria nubilosa]|uniref:Phosphodiest-domain-containing protein n=1 Tax=Teratosphaeria nubilosa TaxID=161662 RepID=A0A6G1L9C1_9PEZI|nr:Phosphodiest-domain-containing protein [Teratosphaeria nubilosa]
MAREDYEKVEQDDAGSSEAGSGDETTSRTSNEARRHDHETLTAEEEAERLLLGGDRRARSERRGEARQRRDAARTQRREKRQKQRSRRRQRGNECPEKEMIYDMEEGAESSSHSSEVDIGQFAEGRARQKKKTLCSHCCIYLVIVVALLVLLFGAWKATSHSKQGHGKDTLDAQEAGGAVSDYVAQHLSNGTHTFAPTTVLISLDGFRADFVFRNLTPTLQSLARSGISPKYMLPSFPSLTFPNHYTLVTGMHPESHGIVGNTFWDPVTQQQFHHTVPSQSMRPEWWNAEPLWVTAERAGVRSAIHMWPGSEAHIGGIEPAYVDKFNMDEPLHNKVHRILGWLDQPGLIDESTPTPQLIAAYVPNVDSDGHKYGPNSTYIRTTIAEVDGMLKQLFNGIDERNLTDIINLVVISDHGMATIATKRLIQLEDLIDTSLIEHTDGWPLYGLRPKDTSDAMVHQLYDQLVQTSQEQKYKGLFQVYLRDENMPERYHFSKNARIAPLWIEPKTGWAIVTKDEYNVAEGRDENWDLLGLHGYDNQHPLMRAIFVARGPAFPHVAGSELAPFQNTEVYNIVCDSLGIKPAPNNGTLRLPLRPMGTHDFDQPADVPEDPQDEDHLALPPEVPNLNYHYSTSGEDVPSPSVVPNLANKPDLVLPTDGVPPVISTPSKMEGNQSEYVATTAGEADSGAQNDKGGISGLWAWMDGKLQKLKSWVSHVLEGDKGKGDKAKGDVGSDADA